MKTRSDITCAAPIWPTLNRLIVVETIINASISIPIALLAAWLAFPHTRPISLWGMDGVAFDLIPSTFIPGILMSFATTLGLRARIRKGMAIVCQFNSLLPKRLPLRLLSIGIGALVIMVPFTLFALYVTWSDVWSWQDLMLFKVAYAVVVSIVLTPFVVIAALRLDA